MKFTGIIKEGERRGRKTEFLKGCPPKNKMPVGAVTFRMQKGDQRRAWVKVAEPNFWIPRAQHIWTSSGGAIPKGFVLHHIDENASNDSIDNLMLLTRSAHRYIHEKKLLGSRGPMSWPDQSLICKFCSIEFSGKRDAFTCPTCKVNREKESKRAYKQRIRAARGG